MQSLANHAASQQSRPLVWPSNCPQVSNFTLTAPGLRNHTACYKHGSIIRINGERHPCRARCLPSISSSDSRLRYRILQKSHSRSCHTLARWARPFILFICSKFATSRSLGQIQNRRIGSNRTRITTLSSCTPALFAFLGRCSNRSCAYMLLRIPLASACVNDLWTENPYSCSS